MILKTVGELRSFIKENDGEVEIGKLRFKYSGPDVDILFCNELIQWYSSVVADEVLLVQEGMFSFTNSASQVREELNTKIEEAKITKSENIELKEKITQLEEKITQLEKTSEINLKAVGAVEAYEKILLKNKITVEN